MLQGLQRTRELLTWIVLLYLVAQSTAQLAPPGSKISDQLLQRYLSNEELAAWLHEYTHKCANISRKHSIGKSVNGADLWVLEISDQPGQQEAEPSFKYVGNMHGDEPSGRALLPQLAEWLCEHYNKDARATRIVRDMHLFIMPTMNPDGFAIRRRNNANGVDLNRNFPDPIEVPDLAELRKPLANAQPETRALMDWLLKQQFTAAANLHEGAVVANYPFDGFTDHSQRVNGTRNPSPDDDAFVHLAKVYARAHKTMDKSKEFQYGIVNGAQWYPVYGGMQDWSYLAAGCLDITLELSDDKWRPPQDLTGLWDDNREALLALPLAAALGGARGVVVAADGSTPLPATIVVDGIKRNSSASQELGYYNRPLAPGTYKITAMYEGYEPATAVVSVPEDGSGVVRDFKLMPLEGSRDVTLAVVQEPHLKLAVLKPVHAFGLAVAGLVVCAVGGLVVMMVFQGRLQGSFLSWRPGYKPANAAEMA